MVFRGMAAFLDDATLARTLDELYEAVALGSFLAIDFDSEELAAYPEARLDRARVKSASAWVDKLVRA